MCFTRLICFRERRKHFSSNDINSIKSSHVETVVLLSQQRPKDRIQVELDMTEMDSAETEASYQEIKD